MEKIKIQKYIALCGITSRRKAEQLIKQGKVTVNGKKAFIGERIDLTDKVEINNKTLSGPLKKIYLVLNKPSGYVCTRRSFKNEKNIFSLVKISGIFSIGRLDKNSEGVLLLTNDGDLSLKLTHPRYQHLKKYEILLDKNILIRDFQKLTQGIWIKPDSSQNFFSRPVNIKKISPRKIVLSLKEGKKRQIRLMLNSLGYKIKKLKRIDFCGISLNGLPKGKWRFLNKKEIKSLKSL